MPTTIELYNQKKRQQEAEALRRKTEEQAEQKAKEARRQAERIDRERAQAEEQALIEQRTQQDMQVLRDSGALGALQELTKPVGGDLKFKILKGQPGYGSGYVGGRVITRLEFNEKVTRSGSGDRDRKFDLVSVHVEYNKDGQATALDINGRSARTREEIVEAIANAAANPESWIDFGKKDSGSSPQFRRGGDQ